jgi:hypothetical protein
MFTGGVVTVNVADDTRIDVAQLSGYTPSGEYIETTSDYFSIALDDYTLAAVNYVCAVYSESNVGSQPHESDGNTYATEAQMAWRIRVFEESVFDALSATDDNLANDAQDRCLLIQKVTANGSGVGLTSSNLFSPTDFDNILYSTPSVLSTISGVTITKVSADTPVGDGTVTFDDSGAPTYTLMWTSSTGGAGAAVPFTADGEYNLLDGVGAYITVVVAISQLPILAAPPATETVTITNLYYQEIPRHSADDDLHRNKTGTGIVTPQNPHGMSVDDLEGASVQGALQEHQDVQHCNGIWRESASSIFGMSLIINTPPGGDTLVIQPPATSDLYYVNGRKLNTAAPTNFLFTAANFTAGLLGSTVKEGSKLYEVYVDDDSVLKVNLRADTNPTATPARTVTGVWIVDMSDDHPAGSYDLDCVVTAGPIYNFTWGLNGGSSGLPVEIDNTTPPGVGDAEGQVIRLYDSTGVNWVDLYVNRSVYGPGPDAKLPAGIASYQDTLTVSGHLDYSQNMKIGSLLYWWDISRGTLGWSIDFAGGGGTRQTIDRRPWGNLCAGNLADEALEQIEYASVDELHYSGILFAREELGGGFQTSADLSGLDFPVAGGSFYARGRRLESEGNSGLTVYDASTSLVYVDLEGVVVSVNIGAATPFGNDAVKAMQWVLGSSYSRNPSPDTPFADGDLDYAEKGVPLYVVTASGGNITRFYDVSRNVNGPVEPWSVGGRRDYAFTVPITLTERSLAAFDSLEAAFLHFNVATGLNNKINGATFKLVGDSYIFDSAPVVQPDGVAVEGYGSSASEYPRVNILSVSASGMWQLTGRNRVSKVYLVPTLTDAANDGSALKATDFCVLDRIYADTSPALTLGVDNDHKLFLIDGEGVELSSCDVTTSGSVAELTTQADNCFIHNNKFSGGSQVSSAVTPHTTVYAQSVDGLRIKDNHITVEPKDDASEGAQALYLNDVHGSEVSGNIIFAKNESGVDGLPIQLEDCTKTSVKGNTITGYATSPALDPSSVLQSNDVTGVFLHDCVEMVVRDNFITNVGYGVQVQGPVNGVVVESNQISLFFVAGIKVVVDAQDTDKSGYVSRLTVKGNSISRGEYTLGGAVAATVCGVSLEFDFTSLPALSFVQGLIVEGNELSFLDNDSSGGFVYGVKVTILGITTDKPVISGVQVKKNNLTELDAANEVTGVYVGLKIGTYPAAIARFSVDENLVLIKESSVASVATGIELFVDGFHPDGQVDAAPSVSDNIILLRSATIVSGTGILVGKLQGCDISRNVVQGYTAVSTGILSSARYRAGIEAYTTIRDNLITEVYHGIALYIEDIGIYESNVRVCRNDISAQHTGILNAQADVSYFDFSYNKIHVLTTDVADSACINLNDDPSYFTVKGNDCEHAGSISTPKVAYGILVGDGNFGDWEVSDNRIRKVSSSFTGAYWGLWVGNLGFVDTRGTLNNNVITVDAVAITGTETARGIGFGSSAGAGGKVAGSNNHIVGFGGGTNDWAPIQGAHPGSLGSAWLLWGAGNAFDKWTGGTLSFTSW